MRKIFRRNPWAVALGLTILAVVSWSALADLEPPGPPAEPGTMQNLIYAADIPLTITAAGTYHLAENIVTAGGGIVISTSNVTIDLMGFTLQGGTGHGIFAGVGISNIVVKNGTVRDFSGVGLSFGSAAQCQVIQVRALGNDQVGIWVGQGSLVSNCTAADNLQSGIVVSHGSRVIDSVAYNNTQLGINAPGTGVVVTGCTIYDNNGDGIVASYGSTISNCTARSNGDAAGEDGIVCQWCTVTNCTASDNFEDGIEVGDNARVFGNLSISNNGNGILVTGSANRIEENNVVGNSTFGIAANPATGNFIIRNSAHGNTGGSYDFAAGNSYGAITAGAAGFSNTNSYANWTY